MLPRDSSSEAAAAALVHLEQAKVCGDERRYAMAAINARAAFKHFNRAATLALRKAADERDGHA